MDIEIFKKAVKDELAGIETNMRTFVSDEMSKVVTKTGEDIATIKTDLAKLQARGESPSAEVVKELEKRLVTGEEAIRQFTLQLNGFAVAGANGTAAREAKDVALFRGQFIKDQEKLRAAILGLQAGATGENATRAIDSSLFATGGKLSPETADRFLDFVVEKQIALGRVTTRRMQGPEGKTDELTISSRKLRKATEGTAPTVAGAIGTKRRTLTTVEVIWTEDITLTFLEDNIERQGAETHIARLLATQFGNDMNDLAWNGDEDIDSTPDGFVETNDGWIELAENDSQVNLVNAGSLTTPSNTDILSAMYRSIQFEFLARTDLNYFMPVPFCQRYAEEVSVRETALGDAVLIQGFPALRYFGVPVTAEPHLYLGSAAKGMLTPNPNLYHGIQRTVTVDSEWVPRKRVVEFTITARNDYEYATGKAIVLVTAIPAANR